MTHRLDNDHIDVKNSPYLQQLPADVISHRKRSRDIFLTLLALASVALAAAVILLS